MTPLVKYFAHVHKLQRADGRLKTKDIKVALDYAEADNYRTVYLAADVDAQLAQAQARVTRLEKALTQIIRYTESPDKYVRVRICAAAQQALSEKETP